MYSSLRCIVLFVVSVRLHVFGDGGGGDDDYDVVVCSMWLQIRAQLLMYSNCWWFQHMHGAMWAFTLTAQTLYKLEF